MSELRTTVCFVIPTRDRPDDLARTLGAIGRLPVGGGGGSGVGPNAEVLVVDNGSERIPLAPGVLANGVPVRLECLAFNEGAAARNRVIGRTDADWLVMLDDDSHPVDAGLFDAVAQAGPGTHAVSADVVLCDGRREMGGLPEVFIGCGVALRRGVFEALGGYDASMGYYAEEYDLAARLLIGGGGVAFDPRFRVEHRRAAQGRDMGLILERLVRNNGWVMQRYAPGGVRRACLRSDRRRAREIARREGARAGYARGLTELRRTVHAQERRPMTPALFDRFTGMAHARAAVGAAFAAGSFRTAALVDEGKNAWCVRRALDELGVEIVPRDRAEVLVIATMSPGPMIDALAARSGGGRRVIAPWEGAGFVAKDAGGSGGAAAGAQPVRRVPA